MPSIISEDYVLLQKANKKFTYLKEDIRLASGMTELAGA